MPDPRVSLRIGVCGCATACHGLVSKSEIVINRFGGKISTTPTQAAVTEVLIPTGGREFALAQARCHAFVDFHDGVIEVSLRDYTRRDPRRGDQVYHPFGFEKTRKLPDGGQPDAALICGLIRDLIGELNPKRFRRWRKHMTPTGWQMPQIVTPQEVVTA